MPGQQHIANAIAAALETEPPGLRPLHGGMVAQVYRADWPDGRRLVAKVDHGPRPQLAIEGAMLRYLAAESNLPVPAVRHAVPELLLLEYLPGESRFTPAAEEHLAELLADLHSVTAPACGFEQATLIGLLPQPNPWTESWVRFFAEQRLLHLAELAVEQGRMPAALARRVEALCRRLEEFIDEPAQPALVHGDIWGANLLAQGDRITGVLDPAIYYGHPEVELAYIHLFHSFGETFFRRYHACNPIAPGFFEQRSHVYQLYPLLSHVCHFGGSYVESTSHTLQRLGF